MLDIPSLSRLARQAPHLLEFANLFLREPLASALSVAHRSPVFYHPKAASQFLVSAKINLTPAFYPFAYHAQIV
jgi:hypothetical protein